jgi:hypothetical protein
VCTQGQGTVQGAPATATITTQLTTNYTLAANSVGSATCPISRVESALITVTVGNKVISANSPSTGSLTLGNLPLGSATITARQGTEVFTQTVTLAATATAAAPLSVPFTATRTCGTVSGGG